MMAYSLTNTKEPKKSTHIRPFILALFIALTIISSNNASSYEIQGLPGSTWGNINYSDRGIAGSGAMSWINQGIDWFALPGDIIVNSYAQYSVRHRSKEKRYYNTHGPSIGIELRKSFFTAGIEYYRENFPELETTSTNRGYYGTWYYDWDFKSDKQNSILNIEGFPGSTWGRLDHDKKGLIGSGAMGWINQGVDWFKLPGNIVFNTFAAYSYRGRNKEKLYYNTQGPSIGLEFRRSSLTLGYSYYWEHFTELKIRSNSSQIYLTWYCSWDLKK